MIGAYQVYSYLGLSYLNFVGLSEERSLHFGTGWPHTWRAFERISKCTTKDHIFTVVDASREKCKLMLVQFKKKTMAPSSTAMSPLSSYRRCYVEQVTLLGNKWNERHHQGFGSVKKRQRIATGVVFSCSPNTILTTIVNDM